MVVVEVVVVVVETNWRLVLIDVAVVVRVVADVRYVVAVAWTVDTYVV